MSFSSNGTCRANKYRSSWAPSCTNCEIWLAIFQVSRRFLVTNLSMQVCSVNAYYLHMILLHLGCVQESQYLNVLRRSSQDGLSVCISPFLDHYLLSRSSERRLWTYIEPDDRFVDIINKKKVK